MQRRLLISTLAVAVAAVLLLGVPLGFVVGGLRSKDASAQLKHDATTLATGLQERFDEGLPPDVNGFARLLPDRYVTIVERGGGRATAGSRPPARDTITGQSRTRDFTVIVAADDSFVIGQVTSGLVMIGSLALLAIAVAVGLALLQARRLTRPLQELADAADRLGSGDARPLGRRYGVPELDRVAEGLDGSAQRINELLTAERDFAVDASHQLRTPLTALSMRLEEMIAAADYPDVVREEGAAALTQTERLADVVGHLLGRARRSVSGAPALASVDDIVAQQVVEWEPAFRRMSRKLEVTGEKGLYAYVTLGSGAQVIATLLDNALVHGGGTVTIRTSQTPRSVVIEVRDEGKGVPPELVPRIFERSVSGAPGGTGLGLSLARTVAAADGGQVVLVRPRPAVFALFLPHGVPGAPDDPDEPVVSGPA
ncbi:MAG TPA: HAMP domain-containing sensor histidine kinase [Streptosporangiaceae bacterium]|jgi:signal transduction histidine kinase|nr:HAMP domain-containing sensor histidine kinase [Streptosporangiaceae bacterium]